MLARPIWIVEACVNVKGQPVNLFNGAYATLEGARASLEAQARTALPETAGKRETWWQRLTKRR